MRSRWRLVFEKTNTWDSGKILDLFLERYRAVRAWFERTGVRAQHWLGFRGAYRLEEEGVFCHFGSRCEIGLGGAPSTSVWMISSVFGMVVP
ncbi:MAG: hypothetical protein M2R45_00466 [Verrucomicrobia subdivision 3 bacterium]|nr:hypothetical protein [Limisphaerales bacterium]MCS1413654.1 hypothetical protein [Limisphaerales bacterium]